MGRCLTYIGTEGGHEQEVAAHACRYVWIENVAQNEEPSSSWRIKLDKELEAINKFITENQQFPTAKDEEVTKHFPSKYLAGIAPDSIYTPPGTKWPEIKITFLNEEKIEIIPGRNQSAVQRPHYSFRCFTSQKTNKPKKMWIDLMRFALRRDGYPWEGEQVQPKNPRKRVSDLRKALKNIFPHVEGQPIGGHKKNKGWMPVVSLSVSSEFLKLGQPEQESNVYPEKGNFHQNEN